MSGIGRIIITMSLKICIAAFEYHTGPSGRQCFFLIERSSVQKSRIGMQKTKPLITIQSPAMIRHAIVMYVAIRKRLPWKMRM